MQRARRGGAGGRRGARPSAVVAEAKQRSAVFAFCCKVAPITLLNPIKPEGDMLRYLLPLSAACALSLAMVSAAAASPATAADLSGRKICWDSGSVSSYGPGGTYSNNMSGHGTWAVTGGGVHIHTDRYDYVANVQKLPDGSFHASVPAAGINTSGKYCN
jgi:hypothetical protein